MEKREPPYTVGGTINWYSYYGEWYGGSLKKLKIQLSHDLEVPLLCICTEKFIIQKDVCRASLVVQRLKVHFAMQGTLVRSLVQEDSTCSEATKPMHHNYWSLQSTACAPQQEKPHHN